MACFDEKSLVVFFSHFHIPLDQPWIGYKAEVDEANEAGGSTLGISTETLGIALKGHGTNLYSDTVNEPPGNSEETIY